MSGPVNLQGHGQQYRLLRHIGTGGFGDVYMAEATTKGGITRTVAIKLLKESLSSDSLLAKRMRDEARVLGMLDHRNIVRAEDLLVVEGRPALVMEYVPGANLDWLIHPRSNPAPLPPEILIEISQQVAEALEAAWSRPSQITGKPLELLHRDIKPSNIRITPDGVVKVLDFGISRPQAIQREAQTQRTPPGSRHYAAPEMLHGLPHGPEVDVYALGATIYESISRKKLGMAQNRASAHDLYVEELLENLELIAWGTRANMLRRMLASMLAHDLKRRPSAPGVRQQFAEMRNAFTGIGLQHWAPQVVPNVVRICSREADGPLSGRQVHSEQSLTSATTEQVLKPDSEPNLDSQTVRMVPPTSETTPLGSHRPRWLVPVLAILGLLSTAALGMWLASPSSEDSPWTPIPPKQTPAHAPDTPSVPEASPEPSAPATPSHINKPKEPSSDTPADKPAVSPLEAILVSSPMGIGVSINHIPIGTTPLRAPLAPGTYQLTFHDHKAVTQEIQVQPGQKNRWKFDKATQSIR
ncbi:MAG: protein kinase [Myxococcota bacterium]|nr:protein kinase [Myxococcota bacterium]